MFISLDDSDEWGHIEDYDAYIKSLKTYDQWITDLLVLLRSPDMESYGRRTTVIITTDHGRGTEMWGQHGPGLHDESRFAWLMAFGPEVKKVGSIATSSVRTHLDIRPSIERLLGLEPFVCAECGSELLEITGR